MGQEDFSLACVGSRKAAKNLDGQKGSGER